VNKINISTSYLQGETAKLQFEDIYSVKYPKIQYTDEKSVSDVILNISRENQKSAKSDAVILKDTADMINNLSNAFQNNPDQAILCQGNISAVAASALI